MSPKPSKERMASKKGHMTGPVTFKEVVSSKRETGHNAVD